MNPSLSRRPSFRFISALLAFVIAALPLLNTPRFAKADDLEALSTEFSGLSSQELGSWKRLEKVESHNLSINHLESVFVQEGALHLVPKTSGWYQNNRAAFLFKEIAGDFTVLTQVTPRNRAQNGPSAQDFSLAGLMTRAGRSQKSDGDESWLFVTHGRGQTPGYSLETKSTQWSQSDLTLNPVSADSVEIALTRVGPHIVFLTRFPGGSWAVNRRFYRPDLPATLQVGLIAYTDWPHIAPHSSNTHNFQGISGQPDMHATFDYFRARRPWGMDSLSGRNLSDPASISDAELIMALIDGAVSDPGAFPDVPKSHWGASFIQSLADKGILKGYSNGNFGLNDTLTRAQLAVILARAFYANAMSTAGKNPFKDVAWDVWYGPAVATLKEAGVLEGNPNGTFDPNGPVNRASALKMILQAAKLPSSGSDPITFTDVPASAWFASHVRTGVVLGLVSGYNAKQFGPADPLTRAQAAKIVHLALEQ